jgi:hypothetical protein
MKTEVKELLESENISEIEIVELIQTFQKLVKYNILKEESFLELLSNLGVEKTDENVFLIDEDIEYTFEV